MSNRTERRAAERAQRQQANAYSPISEAQLAANRANAQLSVGPVTAAGKAAVSENRRDHGLTGRFLLLPFEDQEEFNRLVESTYAEHAPQTDTENRLVDSMIQHYWLKERAVNLQNALLFRNAENPELDSSKQLTLYLRYQTTHERAYYRAIRELQTLRRERCREQNGFESQKRAEEKHTAQLRLTNARAQAIETDTACRQTMEVPLPGNERLPFQELTHACSNAIAHLVYEKQAKSAAS